MTTRKVHVVASVDLDGLFDETTIIFVWLHNNMLACTFEFLYLESRHYLCHTNSPSFHYSLMTTAWVRNCFHVAHWPCQTTRRPTASIVHGAASSLTFMLT